MDLPIDDHRDEIEAAFGEPGLTIVLAPPGTGKSTRVPGFLADADPERRIACVEPRRIAARSLAHRVAAGEGGSPGGRIGYRVRFDNRISPATRIEFVSRGVFLRELLADPSAPGRYHAILLDEFHERQLETDWIFARLFRDRRRFPALRVGVLSATLDPSPLRALWPDARTVEVSSPLHPVDIRHSPRPTRFEERTLVDRVSAAVLDLAEEGAAPDYLLFLPGYREVRRTLSALEGHPRLRGWDLLPLTGEQSAEEQDRAIRAGKRPRIIAATNLAESSLTVEGVRAVVDGGLARRMEFDPARGLNALRTARIPAFSARQRAGRAGRIDPGVCLRLWSEREERDLSEADPPECRRLELSEWLLRVLAEGDDPEAFPWIDPPPPAHVEEARRLLERLGALSGDAPTDRGLALARFPVHPRLGALLLEGERRGVAASAARLAALAEEDRLLVSGSEAEARFADRGDPADFAADLRLLEAIERGNAPAAGTGARLAAARQVLRQSERLARGLPPDSASDGEERMERLRRCCLAGFPDRVARRTDRGTETYRCADGTSAKLDRHARADPGEWLVALEKTERIVRGTRTALLGGAVRIDPAWIKADLGPALERRTGVHEDPSGRLLRQETVFLGAVEVERSTLGEANASERGAHFAAGALAGTIPLRKWTPAVDAWLARVECLRRHFPELEAPSFDPDTKRLVLEMIGAETATAKEFRNAEILPALRDWLGPELCAALDECVPTTFPVPGRKRPLAVDYSDPGGPRLSLAIQEALRLEGHPCVGGGRVPLTVELLAPNRRPVQVTSDLPAFWKTSYPAIRKDLRGRYPKHDWPDV